MGILKNEVSRQFIAVPDDKKDQIVFKWPDINIRKGGRAIIEADQVAVFMNKGEVLGTLGPGQHKLDADEIMFLGIVVDWATNGNAYRAEIFFVGTREYTGDDFTFGGRIDNVQDPQTGMIITLRVYGNYAMQVVDPTKLILKLTGTVNVENNLDITQWISTQLLKVMRTEITRQIVRNGWPILGLSAFTPEIEKSCIEAANAELADYGLAITRMGNFDVNLDEQDEEMLKGLAKDTAYSRLAGSYGQFAQGQALIGAGEGMAKGGGAGTQAAFMGMGIGMGGQMAQPYPAGPTPPPGPGFVGGGQGYAAQVPPAGGQVFCPNCGTGNGAGAKFCSGCGNQLASAKAFCAQCGTEMDPASRFCSSCGTPNPALAGGAPAPAPVADPNAGAVAPPPVAPPVPPAPDPNAGVVAPPPVPPPVPPAPPAPAPAADPYAGQAPPAPPAPPAAADPYAAPPAPPAPPADPYAAQPPVAPPPPPPPAEG